ncbi:MAG: polysaccharide pyruvyl transferase family protein [Lachnospiraceae bacterium]|nr:polysaccharide pyruvyl transferase family protein [Lachnospiraceae bacterium]
MKILIMATANWQNIDESKNVQNKSFAEIIDLYIGNTGNLMFTNGCKYISGLAENTYEFYDWYKMNDDSEKYKNEINETFDLVIYPLANILQENAAFIKNVIALLKGIKIPIYCMGIGISCNSYENLKSLCNYIKEPLLELITIVDKSGGKFACRGYITKEVLERIWGSESNGKVFATGCPSMYQNGLLRIEKPAVAKEDLRVAVNGKVRDFHDGILRQAFEKYKATYICQDEYCHVLYGEEIKGIEELINTYSFYGVNLLSSKRVKLFYQLPVWYQWVSDNVDFMFGSRIHGNLIALLAGKPAMVYLPPKRSDLRVQELAEFFAIPVMPEKTKKDLYEIYEETDYTAFNSNFEVKFNEFEKFLRDAGICSRLESEKNAELNTKECQTKKETIDYEKLKASLQEIDRLHACIYKLKDRICFY